jgi:protein-tyrosine phosphatase
MPKILFVCTANQFRSPLAAAYFSFKLQQTNTPGTWDVTSAGTWAKSALPANSKAIELGDEFQLDLRSHQTREVNLEFLDDANLILVMEQGQKESLCFEFPQARHKIMLLNQISSKYAGDISDPASNNFEDARLIASTIFNTIDTNFDKITELSLLSARSRA